MEEDGSASMDGAVPAVALTSASANPPLRFGELEPPFQKVLDGLTGEEFEAELLSICISPIKRTFQPLPEMSDDGGDDYGFVAAFLFLFESFELGLTSLKASRATMSLLSLHTISRSQKTPATSKSPITRQPIRML